MTIARAVLLAVALGGTACGDSDPAGPGSAIQNDLIFTRADGSTIAFAGSSALEISCGSWEAGMVATPSLQVRLSGQTGWHLRAVLDDVAIGQPLSFPNGFIWDQPQNVDLFILDVPNELSTQDGRSSGSITFQVLSCVSGGQVSFTIDAVIGSEFGNGPSVTVTGSFNAPVG
jgi:hypothetical protein